MSALTVERSREKIALSRDAVQKKTFTKWINSHLVKAGVVVEDLYFDLRDGRNLILLLEMLTVTKLPREKGSLRFHKLQDINTVLTCLEKRKIDTINITNTDILDGSPKLTLGLVWRLILHFQISTVTVQSEEGRRAGPVSEVKQIIKKWCRAATQGYLGVSVDNFSTCWKDGLAFNAILNRFRPDLVDFDGLHPSSNMANLQQAFSFAEKEFGVIQLLDAEDFNMAVPDENSILTYISLLIKALPDAIPQHPKYIQASERWAEYERIATVLMSSVDEKMGWLDSSASLQDMDALKAAIQEAGEFRRSTMPVWAASKERAEALYADVEEINKKLSVPFPVTEELSVHVLDEAWNELLQAFDKNVQLWNEALQNFDQQGQDEKVQVEVERINKMLLAQTEALRLLDDTSKDSEGARERLEEVQVHLEDIQRSVLALNEQISTTIPGLSSDDSAKQRLDVLQERMLELQGDLASRLSGLEQKSAAASEYTRTFNELSIWLQSTEESLASAQWSADAAAVKELLSGQQKVHADIVSKGDAIQEFCSQELVPGQTEMNVKLEDRYNVLKNDSQAQLSSLEWTIDAADILEWIRVNIDPELMRDMATSDADEMTECQERLNEAMDAKEDDITAIEERFDTVLSSKLPASGRKVLQGVRKLVQDKWQELENVYNSMESNIDLVEKYQETKGKLQGCKEQLKLAQALWETAELEGSKSKFAEAEEAFSNLSNDIEGVSVLAAEASPLHKRLEAAPKKFFVNAVCTMNIGRVTLTELEECLLIDNADRRYWKIATTAGSFLDLPSPLLRFPPPAHDLLAELQSLEADISEGQDRISTMAKQLETSAKRTAILADAEVLLTLEVDENFDSLLVSREELLERCKLMIPDLIAEGDSATLEKIQVAEEHWQSLCAARQENKMSPYLEFSRWLASMESRLISQSDLPRQLNLIQTEHHKPLQEILADMTDHRSHLEALDQLKEENSGDTDICEKIDAARARYENGLRTCAERIAILGTTTGSLSQFEAGMAFATSWLDTAEAVLDEAKHLDASHDALKQQQDRCKKLQDDAEREEEKFTECLRVGQAASEEAQTWQDVLTDYMDQLKQVCSAEELAEVSRNVAGEQEEVALVIDEIPDELVSISERYEGVLMALRREDKRINQQLTKSGRVHDLLDEVAAWLKESERIALQESAEDAPATLGEIEDHMDILDELESGTHVQDALMMQALAAYEDFVDSRGADATDKPSVVTSLSERLQTFKDMTGKRKQLLRDLHEQTEVFERQCTEQMYFLASAEETAKKQVPPSLDLVKLNEQIKQHNAFHHALDERQPHANKVKASGEALLSNPVSSAVSREQRREQLTDLLSSNGHLLLQSSARQKQLARTKESLENFSETLDPSLEWISGLEEQLCADGPPAVDAPTLKNQTERVEKHHQSLQLQSKQLAGILAAGQQVLLTFYMSSSSRVTVTHKIRETEAETGNVLREEAIDKLTERSHRASNSASVGSATSALSGTVSLGELPPERFVVERRSRGDETDGAVRIDVLAIAADAVADGTANWVQRECVDLPRRFQAAAQSCVVRIRELATMKAHVDSFDSGFVPLLASLLELQAQLAEQVTTDGDRAAMAPPMLQQQLDAMKALLKKLSEKGPRVTAVLDSGRGVLDKHNAALDSLKEDVAKMSAHRGAVVLGADILGKETAPGVEALQQKLAQLQKLWDDLNGVVQAGHAELEATLTVSKDLNEAITALAQEIGHVGQLCSGLAPLSADKALLTKQVEDLKAVTRQVASVQTKASALASSSANSPAMKRSLTKLEEDYKKLEVQLTTRDKAVTQCRSFLDDVDNLHPWLSEKEAYIAALPSFNTDLLKVFALGVKAEEPKFTSASSQCSALTDDYGDVLDRSGFARVSESLTAQYQALSVAAGRGFENATTKIGSDCEKCQRDAEALVTSTPLPLSSSGVKEEVARVQDLRSTVEGTEFALCELSLVLDGMQAEGVDGVVTEPSSGMVRGLEECVRQVQSALQERSAVLASAAALAEDYEVASCALNGWLVARDDQLVVIADNISDDSAVLEQQVADLKSLLRSIEEHQPSVCEMRKASEALVSFGSEHKTQESDIAAVTHGVQRGTEHCDKLLQDTTSALGDVAAQLANVQEFEGKAQTLNGWLDERKRDLQDANYASCESVAGFEQKLQALEIINDGMASHEADKGSLWKCSLRIAEAKKKGRTSRQPASSSVGEKASLVEQKWSDVASLLDRRRQELDDALKHATATSGDVAQLEKWMQATRLRVGGLSVCACMPDMVERQQSELQLVKSELLAGSAVIAKVASECQDLRSDDALRDRLASAEADYKSFGDAVAAREQEYVKGKVDAEQFAASSTDLLGKLSDIADASSVYLLKQPPSSLEALDAEQQTAESLKAQLDEQKECIVAVVARAEAMLQPVNDAVREGSEQVQERRDEIQSLVEQITKDIDAQQKHLGDAARVARIFHQKCENVEGPFAEMEKLLLEQKDGPDTQTLSASIIQDLATKEPDVHGLQQSAEDLKNVCDPEEHGTIDQQVDNIVVRWHELQREAMQRLAEMETAAKYAVGFQEKLEPFLEWLKDFEELKSARIGLTHAEIKAVFLDVQAMSDTLTLQKADLQELWLAAEDLMDQSGAASGRVQQEMDRIQACFNQQAIRVSARMDSVQRALHAATEFEHPFSDLTNEKSGLEVSVLHPEPLTGSLEDSQLILQNMQEVHEKTALFTSQVEAIHRAGEVLLEHTEADQARQGEFRDALDDFQAAWGVLQLRAGLRVEKIHSAIAKIETFIFSHLSPMLEWMAEVESTVSPDMPVVGDLSGLQAIAADLESVERDIAQHESSYAATENAGRKLIKDVLDDPFVTEEQLIEVSLRWEKIKSQLSRQQQRVSEALSTASELDGQLQDALRWLNDSQSTLSSMAPASSVDLATVEGQLLEVQEFTSALDAKLPEVRALLERGRKLLAVDRCGRRTSQSDVLDELDQQCSDMLYQANERTVDIEASILALRGLQEAVAEMRSAIDTVDTRLAESEAEAISGDLPGVRAQLDIVMLLQEDMHHLQPRMDVLSKALRDATRKDRLLASKDPQMKAIADLQQRWKLLWLRASQRQSTLEDVLADLQDAEAARNFDYNGWRESFVQWLDEHNVRVLDLFNWSDDQLRREQFLSGLEKCGHPMNRAEMCCVADMFEPGKDGIIDYWAFSANLRPDRQVKFKHKAKTEAEQVDQEVRTAVSHCTCVKQFRVEQVGDARYMFGNSEMIRMVRILRTLVMVRVGGGWQNLDEFLDKHDPCRAQANAMLLKTLRRKKLSGGAVKSDAMSSFVSHTQSNLQQRHNRSLHAAAADPLASVSTKSSGGRRQVLVTKRAAVEKGKPSPHVIDGDSSSPRIRRTHKVTVPVHSDACSQHQHQHHPQYSPYGDGKVAPRPPSASSSNVARTLVYSPSATAAGGDVGAGSSDQPSRQPGRVPSILSPPIAAHDPMARGSRSSIASPTHSATTTPGRSSVASPTPGGAPRSPKLKRKSSFSKIPVPKSTVQTKIPTPTRK